MSSTTARSISTETSSRGLIDISSLILLAILLAAGFILNMTVGNALAMTGIKPQFIIAAYALAIALTRATLAQSIVYGLISAAVIQFTTSIPGLNFLTEAAGALTMAVLVKSSIGGDKVNPAYRDICHHPCLWRPVRCRGNAHGGFWTGGRAA